jgi:N-glycosylase/DNA lyase
MNRLEDSDHKVRYGLSAFGRYLELLQINPDQVELSCSEEDFHKVWEDYFDLGFDYGKIVDKLAGGEDEFLKEAANYGSGIRILKQDAFEATISFIISQNKNIPAIKSCIEGICERYGKKIFNSECNTFYYTFPTAEVLAQAEKEELRSLKTGYRDQYILNASQAVVRKELDLEHLKNCSFEEAVRTLKCIQGIGEKVANCISLYGLHHIDGFPVDVWIRRILDEIYQGRFDKEQYKGYLGIVQQYMFYYMRYLKKAA